MFRISSIKPHYDKILHVVCTFFAIAWMSKLGFHHRVIIATVLILQILKTIENRYSKPQYKPYGDWLANSLGWLISLLYFSL